MLLRLAHILLYLTSRLPLAGQRRLAGLIAALAWPLSGRRRRVAERNLALCFPDLPGAEHQRLARRFFYHYAAGLVEAGAVRHWPMARLMGQIRQVHGEDAVRAALAAGDSVIFAAPHCGNWEWLALYLSELSDLAVLFKPSGDAAVDQWLVQLRSRAGARVLPIDGAGMRAFYRHLKTGGAIGILPDQEPKEGEGRFAPFFGVPALTGILLPRLALRSSARVFFTTCLRQQDGGFHVHFIAADPAIAGQDTEQAVAAVNAGVECCVRLAPDQYLWSYKRFRQQPPGASPAYPGR